SSAFNNLQGQQINGLVGLSYRFNEQTVLGVFGGYETMDFADAANASFGGQGMTSGVYAAWRPSMGLRFEGQLAATKLDYDASAGGVKAAFNANRFMASVGVTGSTQFGAFTIEPSLKASSLWQSQNAYTDSVGTMQAARSFNTSQIAAGLKASTTIDLSDGKSFSPYAAVTADWRYSSGDTTATLKAMDNLSASFNAGFNAKVNANTTLNLDGTVSGLGLDDFKIWSIKAKLGVGF
ncbi:MAG: autotransporter outer membrane beta-barrel domain-containing protein, partial [Notoacmeibacter sp.]